MEQTSDASGPQMTPNEKPAGADASGAALAWPTRVTRVIATQMRYWRERRGLSAKQLSDKTSELGYRVPRAVIANLENERRDTVGIAEILILSAALDIPPTVLITAVGREETVEILPDVEVPTWLARGWILGARHPAYKSYSHAGWQDGRRAVALFDMHRLLVTEHQQIESRIRRLAEHDQLESGDLASLTDSRRGRNALLTHAAQELAYSLDRIRQHRKSMMVEGYKVPSLPPGLAVALRESETAGRHQAEDEGTKAVEESDEMLPPMLFDLLRTRMDFPQDPPP